jgi:hypothetical protein
MHVTAGKPDCYKSTYGGESVVESPVAARLAGGHDFKDASAGTPDCYRISLRD